MGQDMSGAAVLQDERQIAADGSIWEHSCASVQADTG